MLNAVMGAKPKSAPNGGSACRGQPGRAAATCAITALLARRVGRCRPNTLRAMAFDLKAFFTVTGKDLVEVTAARCV
jgi:hypothetical protein